MFHCKQLLNLNINRLIVLNFNRFVSCRNVALRSSENEIVEKWGKKFAKENVSEIELSIKHIFNHVVGKSMVRIIESLF